MSKTRRIFAFVALFVVFVSTSCNANINLSQPIKGLFKWVQAWGGMENCTARKNVHDSDKNVYIAGYFKGTADFNPDPVEIDEYTSKGSNDCYLIKFDKIGNFKWVKVWGGLEDDRIYDIYVDNRDNVILGGYFGNSANPAPGYTVDFNPSPGKTLDYISNGKRDCFVSSFASNGTLRWASTWGGAGRDEVEALTADSRRNVYIAGIFEDTIDFDPDPVETSEMTSVGSNDIFLSKFDDSGNYQSTQVWGGTKFEAVQTLNIDKNNNLFVGGIFQETVDFDPDSINAIEHTSIGSFDCWFSKFNSNMVYQWTRVWGGTSIDWVYSIAIDSKSNIYVSGYYNLTVDFDPDELNLVNQTSNGNKDAYLSKFDENGIFIWVQTWGGTNGDKSGTVYLDGKDNIYVARIFGEGASVPGYTVDFDPGFEVEDRLSNGYQDCYFTKFDPEGNFIWVKSWGGTGTDLVYSMTVTHEGIIYITGNFQDIVDFNPEDDNDPLTTEDIEERTSSGGYDCYLVVFE